MPIHNIIAFSNSGESFQNSEPSLAVNPLNPLQVIAGAFAHFSGETLITPYFKTINGGMSWLDFGSLDTEDKSTTWKQDGSTALTTTLFPVGSEDAEIRTYSATAVGGFGSPINTFDPGHDLDQPWVRTGPYNHVYVAYNDLSAADGRTASALVSSDGGLHYAPVTLDRVGGAAGQDAPSVRLAVNGSTVYSVFTRWNSVLDTDSSGETRYNAQVVIVRSDDGGADGFTALGAGGNGAQVAAPISYFADGSNDPLTLGQERTGADLAIAVDPNNSNHVIVAYGTAPGATGSGQLQLIVTETLDGGATWTQRFQTSTTGGTKSALPALAIALDGSMALLYATYDPGTDQLKQHIVTTNAAFGGPNFPPHQSTFDVVMATESNATPIADFQPYVGDFYDMTSVGGVFYGVFSASNAVNGTDATIPGVSFQRAFTGTPGSADFHLTDTNGNPVPFSIDPYFFTAWQPNIASIGWAAVATDDFTGDGVADLIWQNVLNGNVMEWVMSRNGGVASAPSAIAAPGSLVATGDFNADGISDLMWQDPSTGATIEWLMSANGGIGSIPGTPGAGGWNLVATGDFNGDGPIDLMWQNASTGATSEWLMSMNGGLAANPITPSAQGWSLIATGDFNADGIEDLMWQNVSTGGTSEWLMSAAGGLGSNPSTPGAQGWNLIATGDFNGDGTTDLMWQEALTGGTSEWLMAKNGGLGANPLTPSAAGWTMIATGDFNGDGIKDLMWQNLSTGATSEWLMSANGGLGSNPSTPGTNGWNLVTTGDFNGDGATDLVWRNATTSATSEWLMSKNGGLAANPATPPTQTWALASTGDFNGDGIKDLMWQNAPGDSSEWLMSANGGVGNFPATPLAGSGGPAGVSASTPAASVAVAANSAAVSAATVFVAGTSGAIAISDSALPVFTDAAKIDHSHDFLLV